MSGTHEELIKELRDCIERECSRDGGAASGTIDAMMKAAVMLKALSVPGDAEREELARLRLLHAGQKAHEKALQQELTEYGVPENWPEYQELRAKLIAQGNNCLDEKPSAQNRLQYFFKNCRPVAPVVTDAARKAVSVFQNLTVLSNSGGPLGSANASMSHGSWFLLEQSMRALEAALNVSQPGVK